MIMRAIAYSSAVAAMMLLTGAAAAQQPTTPASKRAQQLFSEGLLLVDAEKWSEAEAKFEQAWAQNPSVSVAANLGQVQARLGKYKEAAEHLEFAVRYWPSGQEEKRQRTDQRLTE